MEDTQDLIFEIEGNVGSVGSSDLLGVVSLFPLILSYSSSFTPRSSSHCLA